MLSYFFIILVLLQPIQCFVTHVTHTAPTPDPTRTYYQYPSICISQFAHATGYCGDNGILPEDAPFQVGCGGAQCTHTPTTHGCNHAGCVATTVFENAVMPTTGIYGSPLGIPNVLVPPSSFDEPALFCASACFQSPQCRSFMLNLNGQSAEYPPYCQLLGNSLGDQRFKRTDSAGSFYDIECFYLSNEFQSNCTVGLQLPYTYTYTESFTPARVKTTSRTCTAGQLLAAPTAGTCNGRGNLINPYIIYESKSAENTFARAQAYCLKTCANDAKCLSFGVAFIEGEKPEAKCTLYGQYVQQQGIILPPEDVSDTIPYVYDLACFRNDCSITSTPPPMTTSAVSSSTTSTSPTLTTTIGSSSSTTSTSCTNPTGGAQENFYLLTDSSQFDQNGMYLQVADPDPSNDAPLLLVPDVGNASTFFVDCNSYLRLTDGRAAEQDYSAAPPADGGNGYEIVTMYNTNNITEELYYVSCQIFNGTSVNNIFCQQNGNSSWQEANLSFCNGSFTQGAGLLLGDTTPANCSYLNLFVIYTNS